MLDRFVRPATVAAATLLCVPSFAQTGILRDALPASTVFYFSAPDLAQSADEMGEMPLMRIWREEEVQDFLADARAMLAAKWEEGMAQARQAHEAGQLPFSPDDLMKLRVFGLDVALTQLDLAQGDHGPVPQVGIVAHLDFGDTAPIWRNMLEFALAMLEGQAQGDLVRETFSVGDVEVTSLVPPETGMSLNVAFHGNGMLFGTVRDDVQAVLGRMASGDAALSKSSAFAATFANLDRSGMEAESFVQPKRIIDFVMKALAVAGQMEPDLPVDPEGVGRAIAALGLNGLGPVGSTMTFHPNEMTQGSKNVSRSFVSSPADQRTGVLAATGDPLDMSFLRWVPKDVGSFSASSFKVASLYDTFVGALKAYDADLAQHLLGQLAQHEEQLGVSLRDDLFGSLGEKMVSWSMPVSAMMSTPETAILMEVHDQDKLVRALRAMTGLFGGTVSIEENERRGLNVYSVMIDFDTGGMGFNPLASFSPSFTFHNGFLVAGFSTTDLKRAIKRMDREDDPEGDIRSNSGFAPYLSQLPENAASVSYSDWGAQFEGVYQMLVGVAAMLPIDEDIPIDLSLLPDVSTLTQHLFPGVSWSQVTDEGMSSTSVGPWGPEVAGLVAAAVGAGVGVAARFEGR